jgi:hypothetical protein
MEVAILSGIPLSDYEYCWEYRICCYRCFGWYSCCNGSISIGDVSGLHTIYATVYAANYQTANNSNVLQSKQQLQEEF